MSGEEGEEEQLQPNGDSNEQGAEAHQCPDHKECTGH
jgi:hypothetical protein